MSSIVQEIGAAVRAVADRVFSGYSIYRPWATDSKFEIKAQPADNPLEMATALEVYVNERHREVHIPTIILHQALQKKGDGKAMIAAVREVSLSRGYRLFVTNLVPSFYRRLVARGAPAINHEVVEITADTDLSHHHAR